jgi:hypothetical protein
LQINFLVFDRSPQALDVYLCRSRLLGTAPMRVSLGVSIGAVVGVSQSDNRRLGQVNAAGRPFAAPVETESRLFSFAPFPEQLYVPN